MIRAGIVALLGYWYASMMTSLVSMNLAATAWATFSTYLWLLGGAVLGWVTLVVVLLVIGGILGAGIAAQRDPFAQMRTRF